MPNNCCLKNIRQNVIKLKETDITEEVTRARAQSAETHKPQTMSESHSFQVYIMVTG